MSNKTFRHSEIFSLVDSVEYAGDSIVSKTLVKNGAGNLSLFAFDKGQALSPHAAPYDAFVQILDGQAKIIIEKSENILKAGEIIIMPANIEHAVEATEKFKMLLTMIKA